jgi:hypothetical protein
LSACSACATTLVSDIPAVPLSRMLWRVMASTLRRKGREVIKAEDMNNELLSNGRMSFLSVEALGKTRKSF